MASEFENKRWEANNTKWANRRKRWNNWKNMTHQERFDDWKAKHPHRADCENPYFAKERD